MEDAIKNIDALPRASTDSANPGDQDRRRTPGDPHRGKWTHTKALFEELKQIIRTIGKG
jgi:hypothetical protein